MKVYEPADIARPKSYAYPEKLDDLFIRLRKEDPIPWIESDVYRPFWAITKFSDIVEILSKPEIFHSGPQQVLIPKAWEEQRMKKLGRPSFVQSLIVKDPPDHAHYRKIFENFFNATNMTKLKSKIFELAKFHVNMMRSYKGECDFVSSISKLYPLRTIMMILGIQQNANDEQLILNGTSGYFPETVVVDDNTDIQMQAQMKMFDYFKTILNDRIANPKEDLTSLVASAKINEMPLSEHEQLSIMLSFGTAGHDTTGYVIAGAMLVFAQHPELLQQLKKDRSLLPAAIEEMFRWTVPAKMTMRNVVQDYQIRGKVIKAGDRVGLCHQSANRDEESIKDPFEIRFDRRPNRHLTFGSGPHVCLGMHLSRLEVTTLFEELIPHLEFVEVNGKYSYAESPQISGLKMLPIKYKMNLES